VAPPIGSPLRGIGRGKQNYRQCLDEPFGSKTESRGSAARLFCPSLRGVRGTEDYLPDEATTPKDFIGKSHGVCLYYCVKSTKIDYIMRGCFSIL
jgi:hypothetical protein